MEVKAKHFYDASVDAVFACFGNAEKITAKLEALGARNIDVSRCDLTADSLEIDITREVPTDAPGMMKKFLSDWNSVHQTETWTGKPGEHFSGNFNIELHGVPVTIKGTCELTPTSTGSVNDVTVTVECGIPLVGKKLAEFVAHNCQESMEKEYQLIKKAV